MWNIFGNANKKSKNVKQWEKEHRQLENLAGAIIGAYDKGDVKETRKQLGKLKDVALNHLMNEDLTFYEMKRKVGNKDKDVFSAMAEFETSFREVKLVLIKFLDHYSNPEVDLDEEFKTTFDVIVGVLVERIQFEESNLYVLLDRAS